MVDVRFELTTNDPWSVDDAICEGISPLSYCTGKRLTNRLPKLSLITLLHCNVTSLSRGSVITQLVSLYEVESARILGVLDVGGEKECLNVKDTPTIIVQHL